MHHRELIREGVHRVSVIPHDAEIRSCGLHLCKLAAHLLGESHACRVAENRHRPHALHRRILHQITDHIHVGAVVKHGNRQHLETKMFGDGEVPVVARDRAQPLHYRLILPRTGGIISPPNVGGHDQVKHNVQARRIPRIHLINGNAQQLRINLTDILNTSQTTIVTAIRAIRRPEITGSGQAKQLVGEIQLLGRRLPPSQIQSKIACFQILIRL